MTELDTTAVEIGSELVPAEPVAATNLFRTDDPVEVLAKATVTANALKAVLVEKGMIQRIGPSEHVRVEGWQTLGAMLGVVPVVAWTRKLERGWEARVEARTLDGRVVGAGEAECLRDEANWRDSDDYAVRSMAQTRATSKALAGPLRFVITLAGFSGTPAEEMHGVRGQSPGRPSGKPSESQQKYLRDLISRKGITEAQLRVMLVAVGAPEVGTRTTEAGPEIQMDRLTAGKEGTCSALIEWLKERPLPDPDHASDVPSDFPVTASGPDAIGGDDG